uniref:Uncharacterized protein n=1 Tax=Arundo donax TaxID=35708 RepID=A0A0A9E4A0_ARUDO
MPASSLVASFSNLMGDLDETFPPSIWCAGTSSLTLGLGFGARAYRLRPPSALAMVVVVVALPGSSSCCCCGHSASATSSSLDVAVRWP